MWKEFCRTRISKLLLFHRKYTVRVWINFLVFFRKWDAPKKLFAFLWIFWETWKMQFSDAIASYAPFLSKKKNKKKSLNVIKILLESHYNIHTSCDCPKFVKLHHNQGVCFIHKKMQRLKLHWTKHPNLRCN